MEPVTSGQPGKPADASPLDDTVGAGRPEPRLAVSLGGLELANPVMPASGCFGPELGALIDLDRLGALVTKTVFLEPRSGNPAHRLAESYGGMLNSVGIPSRGLDFFLRETLPSYARYRPPTIVSIGGLTVDEYFALAERLRGVAGIAALEVNVSCPNLEAGGIEMGADWRQVERVVRGVVRRSSVPVFAKLTPNVTSIADLARASEQGGAAAITAVNTYVGMAVDLDSRRPILGMGAGGVSGPAIKPLALRMVWAAARAVSIPVVGVGGITTARDALEFMVVGARAVQVGTATFTRPDAMLRILDDLAAYLREHRIGDVNELVGTLRLPEASEVAPELAGAYSEARQNHPRLGVAPASDRPDHGQTTNPRGETA